MGNPRTKLCVTCKHCGGRGRVELAGIYAETAVLVGMNPGLNGAQLAMVAGCEPTAMNNRLRRLEDLGIVEGQSHGRQIIWRRRKTLRGS